MNDPERKLFDAVQEYVREAVPQIAQFMGEQTGGVDFLSGFVSNLTGGGSKPTPANETAKERHEQAKGAFGEANLHDIGSPMRTNKLLESIASSLLILVERGLR